jgi:molecular chaperone GrpE
MVNENPTRSDASDAVQSTTNHAGDESSGLASESGEQIENSVNPDASPDIMIAALRAQLEQALADGEAQREQALRAVAEADNVRKRAQRDQENARKFALERFVNELLPVKDSLELGLAAAADEVNLADLKEGTQMTLRMFASAIEKFGVREVASQGEAFDPQLHQAMTMREVEGQQAGVVLDVVQKGYLLNDRLVRPAMVIVSK